MSSATNAAGKKPIYREGERGEREGEGERGEREGRRDRVNLTGLFTHSASCRQSVIATLLHVRRIANSVPA